jgi:CBS domain containing-hemolysin-like protein
VLDQVRRIPPVGHTIQVGKVTLTVTQGSERGIDEVRLTARKKR